ncbi:MAG: PIG-L family deacetylase, partial [Gemmatimonadaceae bacterium]
GNTSRVLVIGAHPDDEDTQLIAWLARGRHVETAYLSLTRGDGGQNLLGNELGEGLGVIRTQELLAARRIDGGRQFFTRAFDFGFSKNAEETLNHWPRDTVMGDVIRAVRAFRPQIIVAVFSGTPADGHGHHQISGILAREAYDISSDTVKFPTAVYGTPWTVSKFYRRIRTTTTATTKMNVGEYDALLGRSYAEIAADSRSQHKSQGFGQLQPKGAVIDQIGLEASRVSDVAQAATEGSIFNGIDSSWTRLRSLTNKPEVRLALDSASLAFDQARVAYRANDPTAVIDPLARAVRMLRVARDGAGPRPWRLYNADPRSPSVMVDYRNFPRSARAQDSTAVKATDATNPELWNAIDVNEQRAEQALVMAAGVAVEAISPRQIIPVTLVEKKDVPDSVSVNISVYNRGRTPVKFVRAEIGNTRDTSSAVLLAPDSTVRVSRTARARSNTTQWWRAVPRTQDYFRVEVDSRDDAERAQAVGLNAQVRLEIGGIGLDVVTPIMNRAADPVKGEQLVAVAGVPGIVIGLDRPLEYIRANVPVVRELRVNIESAYAAPESVTVTLQLPNGLVADSAARTRVLSPESPRATVVFMLRGKLSVEKHALHAIATHKGVRTQAGYYVINYDHINVQRVYTAASMWLQSVAVTLPPKAYVGYVAGVGDLGFEALRQLDVNVERIEPAALATTDLKRFTSIVVGPRAYASNDLLVAANARLLDYTKKGGTMVVQYGQTEMMKPGIMPYPIQLARTAERVTLENAPVTILAPASRLLNVPNKIGPTDWDGWVQERATYMPSTFDKNYSPLLQMNDPDEPPNKAGLLMTQYGRGTYVYVTLALFRQLPAGVPGAARLLLNLISATPAAPPRM